MTEFHHLHGTDPSLILRPHKPRLDELQMRWDQTLPEVASQFGLAEHEASPLHLQEATINKWMKEREAAPDSPLVIGIAGPGASGKGTVSDYLENSLGYPKIINTTTRPRRDHIEVDGLHYHFLTDDEFEQKRTAGDFLTVTERPNRGSYAISKSEIEAKLPGHAHGCVIEENPLTLLQALEASKPDDDQTRRLAALLYVLPREPIMETLATRLHGRSSVIPSERKLTTEDIESTLGDRQIEEFSTLTLAAHYPDVHVVFLVNDDLEQTRQKLDILFGMHKEAQ